MVTDGLLDLGLGDPAALPILLDFRTQSVEPTLRLEFEQGAPHGIHLLLGQTVDLLVQERAQIFRIDIGKCAHGAKIATGRVLFQTIPPTRLKSLAHSANARNARMGRWYLRSLEEAAEPSLFVAWECARAPAAAAIASTDLVLYVNPELQRLRALVDAARARLAEREAGFTIEKAKVEAMKARLFARLREHFQRRDRLRLVIGYRRKYLESLVRQGEEEAGKIAQEYRQASAQHEQEYAETAAALAEKQELSAEEAAEVSQLWRKLVKLFHPEMAAEKIRNPNLEIRNKFQKREGRERGAGAPTPFSGISIFSDLFRISDFDIRIFPRRGARARATAPPVGEH